MSVWVKLGLHLQCQLCNVSSLPAPGGQRPKAAPQFRNKLVDVGIHRSPSFAVPVLDPAFFFRGAPSFGPGTLRARVAFNAA